MDLVLNKNFSLISEDDLSFVNGGGAVEALAGSIIALGAGIGFAVNAYEATAVATAVLFGSAAGLSFFGAGILLGVAIYEYQNGNL